MYTSLRRRLPSYGFLMPTDFKILNLNIDFPIHLLGSVSVTPSVPTVGQDIPLRPETSTLTLLEQRPTIHDYYF